MFLLGDINPLSLKLLNQIYRESRHHQVRQRTQLLIWVSQDFKNEKLLKIFKISYKTMYNWLNRWENKGMLGLYKPGRGRKKIFNPAESAQIKNWVKLEPKQLKQVVQKIKKEWSINTSTETIKRIIKKKYELA
ncbi:helix-turn-helix domain-containing protein [Microcoleus sp. S36b_A3]|uniref:helix-turn-helix domain-containing protein n=1 Tax=unclassified Microcoleus TaxID=2642155 RepID=UPI002FD58916